MHNTVLKRLKAWRDNPVLFVQEALGATPTKQQLQGLEAMMKCKRLTIRSGHGTGKSAFAAWRILHFMSTRPFPKVVCTAPTARQLSDVLWSELSKWLRKSALAEEFVLQSDKLFHKDAPKEWWCRAVSPAVKASKEDQAETLAGFHGEHLLIIVDESSGVEDPVFIPLEGALTQEDNHVMLIGNMTRSSGYFYDTHFGPMAEKWTKLHWDSRESSNVSAEMIDYFATKYGEESNVFRIRVKGEPPLDDAKAFIPLHWAEQCIGNTLSEDPTWPVVMGVDVAREGEDNSVILPRQGNTILPWHEFNGMNTYALGREIVRRFQDNNAALVGIDTVGIGGGVYDWLVNDPGGLGHRRVLSVYAADAARDKTKHFRLRDELWDLVREKCMKRQFSFPDLVVKRGGMDVHLGKELCNELSFPYFEVEKGPIKVESKKHMKMRGVKSPNIADALCISEFIMNYSFSAYSTEERKKRLKQNKTKKPSFYGLDSKYSWMVA